MNDERRGRLESFLERTARALSGGTLHPAQVLSEVEQAWHAAARPGAAPNRLGVAFSPEDFVAYRPALDDLRAEVEALMADLEQRANLPAPARRMVRLEADEGVRGGSVRVRAGYADTSHRPAKAAHGETRRIEAIRGLTIVLGDGTRVPLTHLPFTIGRGAGCDLVIPSLNISRRHAEFVRDREGLVLRDLGSRNGIEVDGARLDAVLMTDGVIARLGNVDVALEGVA